MAFADADSEDSLILSICTMTDSDESGRKSILDDFDEEVNIIETSDIILREQTSLLIDELQKKFKIIGVTGDGNCFFRAILKASDNDESEHLFLRISVCQFMQNHPILFENELVKKNYVLEYSDRLKLQGTWATKCQGFSENSNRYVKKYLQLAYLTNHTVAFNIKTVLQSITLGYNKRAHSVTKVEPEKAFFTPTIKIKAEIRERTEKYYHRNLQNSLKLSLGDKIGICCKVVISEKGFIKQKKEGFKDSKQKFFRTLGVLVIINRFYLLKIFITAL